MNVVVDVNCFRDVEKGRNIIVWKGEKKADKLAGTKLGRSYFTNLKRNVISDV